jgi:uncharacterized membrane protein YtjA (UPF0391 family)
MKTAMLEGRDDRAHAKNLFAPGFRAGKALTFQAFEMCAPCHVSICCPDGYSDVTSPVSTAFGGIELFVVEAFSKRGRDMLRLALVLLILAIIAGVLGFGGMAGDLAWFAKLLLVVFVVLSLVSLLMGRRIT